MFRIGKKDGTTENGLIIREDYGHVGVNKLPGRFALDVSGAINCTKLSLNDDNVIFWSNNGNDIYYDKSNVGIGKSNPIVTLDISASDALRIPVGNNNQRPGTSDASMGMIRYNTDTSQFEGYSQSGDWQGLGGVINTAQTTFIKATEDDKLEFVTSDVSSIIIDADGDVNFEKDVYYTINSSIANTASGYKVAIINDSTGKLEKSNIAFSTLYSSAISGGSGSGGDETFDDNYLSNVFILASDGTEITDSDASTSIIIDPATGTGIFGGGISTANDMQLIERLNFTDNSNGQGEFITNHKIESESNMGIYFHSNPSSFTLRGDTHSDKLSFSVYGGYDVTASGDTEYNRLFEINRQGLVGIGVGIDLSSSEAALYSDDASMSLYVDGSIKNTGSLTVNGMINNEIYSSSLTQIVGNRFTVADRMYNLANGGGNWTYNGSKKYIPLYEFGSSQTSRIHGIIRHEAGTQYFTIDLTITSRYSNSSQGKIHTYGEIRGLKEYSTDGPDIVVYGNTYETDNALSNDWYQVFLVTSSNFTHYNLEIEAAQSSMTNLWPGPTSIGANESFVSTLGSGSMDSTRVMFTTQIPNNGSIGDEDYSTVTIIDQEGNLGIGTTDPGEALDLSGNATISGDVSCSFISLTNGNGGGTYSKIEGVTHTQSNGATRYGIDIKSHVGSAWNGIWINDTFAMITYNNSIFGIFDDNDNDWILQYNSDGSSKDVKLYYNNGVRLTTTSSGIDVTGSATISTDLTIGGNLTVSGTTTTINTTNMDVSDNIIVLNSPATAHDSGILIKRSDTNANAFMGYDEPSNGFVLATTDATGSENGSDSTINLSDSNTALAQLSVGSLGIGTNSLGTYNLNVSGTTNISGATTLNSTLDVTSATTLNSTVTINQNSSSLTNDSGLLRLKDGLGSELRFGNNNTGNGGIHHLDWFSVDSGKPRFYINYYSNEDVRFGNTSISIGINTNPNYSLDVSGTAYISDATILNSTLDVTGDATISGKLGIGTSNSGDHEVLVAGTIKIQGNPTGTISNDESTAGGGILYIGDENNSTNRGGSIFFGGLNGDNNYAHTVIENRLYNSNDKSELLLFKGNDSTVANMDRIRLRSGEIVFDAFDANATDDRVNENIIATIDDTGLIITGTCEATNFISTSDIRLKENIVPIENALDKVMKLNGKQYNWKKDEEKKLQSGLIAQEVEEVIPEVVISKNINNTNDEDEENDENILNDQKLINYNGIVPYLVECIKLLNNKIDKLNDKINELEK